MKKDRENAFRNSFVSSRNPDEAELTLRASDCVGAQQEMIRGSSSQAPWRS